jgi:hypothetical protein
VKRCAPVPGRRSFGGFNPHIQVEILHLSAHGATALAAHCVPPGTLRSPRRRQPKVPCRAPVAASLLSDCIFCSVCMLLSRHRSPLRLQLLCRRAASALVAASGRRRGEERRCEGSRVLPLTRDTRCHSRCRRMLSRLQWASRSRAAASIDNARARVHALLRWRSMSAARGA